MELGAGIKAFEMSDLDRQSILFAHRLNKGDKFNWDTKQWDS